MKLSKYYHYIELNNNIFAVYNSLIMDVIFVEKTKLNEINTINIKSKSEIQKLKDIGVFISDDNQDNEALEIVKERYNLVTGKVSIMYLILSSACNLACKYCFIENCTFNNKKEINMSIETVNNAINKYAEYIKQENIKDATIIFYGGEPLINWEAITFAIELVKRIKAPIKFSIVTNATLLDKNKIKYLSNNNVEVGISIDGPKKLNDKNRIYRFNNKSVYDEIVKKFPMLELQDTKFGLSITISEDFLNIQDEVLDWLENLGIKSIFYNLYHYTSYEENWEEYSNRASEFLIKSYERLSSKEIMDGRLIRKIDSFFNSEFKFADCGAIGANQLAIKPNGEICICHGYLKTDKYVVGNINNDSLYKIMNTEEIKFWKNRCTLNNEECLKCPALFSCGGGCAIQSEALFGDRNNIDKPFCIHTKKTLKWILQRCYDRTKEESEVKQC